MQTKDLIPKKDETLEWGKTAFGEDKINEWDKSFKETGFKTDKPMLVDWKGNIIDGNIRYHLARKHNIKHVPIDFWFFIRSFEAFEEALWKKYLQTEILNSKEAKEIHDMIKMLRSTISAKLEEINTNTEEEFK